MPDHDEFFGFKLYFFFLFMSFVIDVVSSMLGKKRICEDMRSFHRPVTFLGKSRFSFRLFYYSTMIFIVLLMMGSTLGFLGSSLLKEKITCFFALAISALCLVQSLTMIICTNMSWICYDDSTVYWRKWSDRVCQKCDLKDIINYMSLCGYGGSRFYLIDGRKLHFYSLHGNIENMCDKSGIREWRKKNEPNWPF